MRIRINPELCKKCKKCCRGIPGNMMAARSDRGILHITKSGKCEHLSIHDVCSIVKPLDCALYPISILDDGIYIDKACPGWQSALDQFMDYAKTYSDEMKNQGKYEKIWQPL